MFDLDEDLAFTAEPMTPSTASSFDSPQQLHWASAVAAAAAALLAWRCTRKMLPPLSVYSDNLTIGGVTALAIMPFAPEPALGIAEMLGAFAVKELLSELPRADRTTTLATALAT
eukprot:1174169-Prymnesium_polylepis.1